MILKKKLYSLFLLTCCILANVSSLHPQNFERTKAEDTDGGFLTDDLNLSHSCDLTSQFCDINCCSDQDCSEEEKRSFICSNKEYKHYNKFSYLDCENLESFNSIGNPLLCLHDQNSPYLGDFYEKDENFSSYSFSEILAVRNKGISTFRIIDLLNNNYQHEYKHGSNIFFLDADGQYHNINVFSNVLNKGNGYCSKAPLRFLINEESNCFFLMNEEQCMLNEEFHLQYHVNILKKLELLGNINDVNISYDVVCLRDGTDFVSFPKHLFQGVVGKNSPLLGITDCESYPITEVNKNKTICKNVVVGFNYTIFVNGTGLRSLKVTVLTANIPLNINKHTSMSKDMLKPLSSTKEGVIYTLQKFSVKFENTDFVENIKKHGYVLGKPVYHGR